MNVIDKVAHHYGCTAKVVRAHLRRLGYKKTKYQKLTAAQIIKILG